MERGFVVAENHQGGQHGEMLMQQMLQRLKDDGCGIAISITVAPQVKKLFAKLKGMPGAFINHQSYKKLLALARQRYGTDADACELFTFTLSDIPLRRERTRKKVDQAMRRIPSRKQAERISVLLTEAAAYADGALWHGRAASPTALQRAKRLLAHSGQDIENWRVIAEHHGLPSYSQGYFG